MKDLIKKYNEYNNKKKEYDSKRKEISKVIQTQMEERGIDKQVEDNIEVRLITRQSKKKVDEDRVLEIIKENDIDAIKETPDMDKLEEMIDNNEISDDILAEISDCISVSEYSYIRAKELK